MAGRLSLFSLQIAVALSGIVCCGPGAAAQIIMPAHTPFPALHPTADISLPRSK